MPYRFEIESAGEIVHTVHGLVCPDLDEAVKQARLCLVLFPDFDQLTIFHRGRRVAVIDEPANVGEPA